MTIHTDDRANEPVEHKRTDELADHVDTSLGRHSFLYAGEWQGGRFDGQLMHRVDGGAVTWTYELPRSGEFGDISQLANGNILFAWYGGATEMTPDGTTVWEYTGPENSEIHTCQPLEGNRVFLMINSVPAHAVVIDRSTGAVESDVVVPTGGTNTHGMFRHCRRTSEGTYLIAHMDLHRISEYDATGSEVWSVRAQSPWAAVRLRNGNTLISGDASGYVSEVDSDGHVVWMFDRQQARAQGYELFNVQQAARLGNGNTVIANWCSGDLPIDLQRDTAQLIEVTPSGEIVWALSAWDEPNLGVASNFQLLNNAQDAADPMFQR